MVDGLREGYIHQVTLANVQSESGLPLLHDTAYYTLNRIPQGDSINVTADPIDPLIEPKRLSQDGATVDADHVLTVGTLPGLLFDTESFTVTSGSRVALTFDNNDDMLHNLVVVQGDSVDAVAMAALRLGLRGHDMAYVPESEAVLAHTGLLEPETSQTIYFRAPATPGRYAFVCTFPGHAATMRGTLLVE